MAGLFALVGLTGCADLHNVLSLDPGGVDPNSPVAVKTVETSRANVKYVRFSDVPQTPKNLRPASAFKAQVGGMVDQCRKMKGETASLPAAQSDTEGFARTTSDQVLKLGLTPPSPDQTEQTEAYVAKLRAMAAAPADLSAPTSPPPQMPPPPPPRP